MPSFASSRPELTGEAGYVSPFPYMEKLQDRMEERLERKVPVTGRYCGFCYGRLRELDTVCPFCDTAIGDRPPVDEIPQPVLRAYRAKQRTEAGWVYGGAFVGLIIASFLFIVLELWGPGILGHPVTGFAVLILGGYLLAQLCGPLIAGQFGYRNGARKRDTAWARFIAERDGPKSPTR